MMLEMALAAFAAFMGAIIAARIVGDLRGNGEDRRHARWRKEAKRLGLRFEHGIAPPPGTMTGHLLGNGVRIEAVDGAGRLPVWGRRVRITLLGNGRWPVDVAAGGAAWWRRAQKDPKLRERRVRLHGAAPSDDLVVAGDRAAALSLLRGAAREAVESWLQAVDGRTRLGLIRRGDLVLEMAMTAPDAAALHREIVRMAAVARALDRNGASIETCLANALAKSSEDERRELLALLADATGRGPRVLEACREFMAHADPAMRVHAAIVMGKEGVPVLLEALRGTSTVRGLRAQAARAYFAVSAPLSDTDVAMFGSLLEDADEDVVRVAIEAAKARRETAMLPALLAAATRVSGETASLLAATLGVYDDPRVEPAIVSLLPKVSRQGIVPALQALGRIGTLASVEPIMAAAAMLRRSDAVQRGSREAVAAIRGRMGPVEAGRLSVAAAGGAGNLSLSDDASGQLDQAHEQARLSEPARDQE